MIVVVCSVIIRSDDKVYMVKETKAAAAGLWGLPGGKLEEGESLIECAQREVREETGLEIESVNILRIINKPKSREGNTVVKFVFTATSKGLKSIAEHETNLFTFDEVRSMSERSEIRGAEVYTLIELSTQNESLPDLIIEG